MAQHKMGTSVWIRAETREKLEGIAEHRYWTLAEVVEQLAVHWLKDPPKLSVAAVGSEPDSPETA